MLSKPAHEPVHGYVTAHRSHTPFIYLCLVLAGLLQALSLAWPFEGAAKGHSYGWLQCLSLAVLAWFLDRAPSKKAAFLQAWLFSSAWLLGATWWLFISLNTYGGLAAPLAGVAVCLLASGLALLYGLAAAVFHLLTRRYVGVWLRVLAFTAVWTLAEILRGTLGTGFPWGAIGYAHLEGNLKHWAPWVGVYGLSGIAAGLAMLFAAERRYAPSLRGTRGMQTVVVLVLAFTWYSSPSRDAERYQKSATPLRVTLLQGNIAQDLKFGDGVSRALNDYREALLTSTSDLTVTPETAIPMIPEQMPDHYWAALESHFSQGNKAALIGVPLSRRNAYGQRQYSNSVVGFMPQTTPASTANYQYDKHHLVPFGEFVPPLFQWFVQMLNIPLGDFTRGDVAQPSMALKGERIAPNICYEDLFGEELARSFASPTTAPTIMVNVSNIAWFGDTVAIDQHLNISRMRALELGRPMLRATNTGATAIIDAQGDVSHRLPSSVKGALTADVYGVQGPVTPYAQWVSIYGLWPLVLLACLILGGIAAIAYANRHGPRRFGP
jgi:apolipoprotein N-acyltransferase